MCDPRGGGAGRAASACDFLEEFLGLPYPLLEDSAGLRLRPESAAGGAVGIIVDERRDATRFILREVLGVAAPASRVQVLDGRTGRLLHTVPVGADATALAVDERTGKVFAAAMNVYGLPAGSDNRRWLRAWLPRWLPWSWVSRLLPPAPAPTTGTVTMLDLSRL